MEEDVKEEEYRRQLDVSEVKKENTLSFSYSDSVEV